MDLLRSTLQPLTHNLPPPLRNLGLSLLGPTCYQTLILDLDPTSLPCVRLALSKGLGISIIATSSIVKIPQILKLLTSQSAAGISFLSYLLETSSLLISLAYNVRQGFPFSTYGELALIAVQNVVIAVLVLRFAGRGAAAGAFVAGLAAAGVGGCGVVELFAGGAGALGVASKMPQIWTVWQQGGTGQLSAFAVFNYLMGSLSRIFTTLQETGDKLIFYSYLASFLLNAVLAAQMVYYWNSPQSANHAAELGKEPKKIAMGSSTGNAAKAKSPTTRRRG
ncbi:MAG: mannose-P-dolichol utilization defect 1 [Lasallia pustulata]|uniref:Mannose-P-dolichol utilization defect 1 protein homolog n=1 Tax=Lasallia pustulata TaxID=136370 RepID=A0A5M8PF09_9LECA|nr:MAG: mannose-P-dolichol utilization defect 1 [Lasallia pustulata]